MSERLTCHNEPVLIQVSLVLSADLGTEPANVLWREYSQQIS